jgi:hypothetical protein
MINIKLDEFDIIKKICDEIDIPVYKYLYVNNDNLHRFIGEVYINSNSVLHAQSLIVRINTIRNI